MKATIYISGKIGKDTTLVDVIRQFKSYEDPTEVLAIIDSIGGDKAEGDSIYDYLDGLKSEMPVNTYAKKAYSIGAKIFAVGQERIVDDIDKALMIHFAWAKAEGDAEKFEEVAGQLREMEDEFALFYSGLLNVDEDTVRNLLDNETFISGSEAVDLTFATELKVMAEAVAEYKSIINSNININKMTEKKSNLKAGKELLKAMAAYVGIEVFAELTLQDSNATEIVFPDLESGDTPKVGDSATIDGSAIEDGSYIMPSLEDVTLVFVDGKVSEVIPKEDETETEEAKAERLAAEAAEKAKKEKKTEVNAEEIKEVFTYSVTATNTSFAVGDTVMFEGWDGGEDYAASSGEFKLQDGRSIVTDAAGVIVTIKEANSEEQIIDTEASFEEMLEKVTTKVKTEINAEFEAKLTAKDNEIKALNKKIGSKEFNAEEREAGNGGTEARKQTSVLSVRKKTTDK
jgi:ATP-dependent protease ClpP protease subunit